MRELIHLQMLSRITDSPMTCALRCFQERNVPMRPSVSGASSVLCAVVLAFTLCQQALAKPPLYNNCTTKQINKAAKTKGGKECWKKNEADLLNNSQTSHVIYCSSSGKYLCCEKDKNGKIVDNTCETIQELRVPFTPRPAANRPSSPSPTAEKTGGIRQPGLLDERGGGFGPRGPAATGVAPTAPSPAPAVKLY
jgi:hypothetical protein